MHLIDLRKKIELAKKRVEKDPIWQSKLDSLQMEYAEAIGNKYK